MACGRWPHWGGGGGPGDRAPTSLPHSLPFPDLQRLLIGQTPPELTRGSPAGAPSPSGPRVGDQAWTQELQGKKTPPTWSPRSRRSAAAQMVFSSMKTSAPPWPAPAPLLLQWPGYSFCLHPPGTVPGRLVFHFSRARANGSQRPCPGRGAEMSHSEVEEMLAATESPQSSAEEPRARSLWGKVSIRLFTQACRGLAVCGRHLCLHQ